MDDSLIQVVGITGNGTFIEAAKTTVPPDTVTVATLIEKVARPLLVGSLRLVSLDERENPAVRFNYFSEPEDLRNCVGGIRKVVELLNGRTMDKFRYRRDFMYLGAPLPSNQMDVWSGRVSVGRQWQLTVALPWWMSRRQGGRWRFQGHWD